MDTDELYGIVNNITSVSGDDRQNCLPSNESETDMGLGQKLINTDPHTDEFSSMFTCIFPNISNPKFNLSLGNLQTFLQLFTVLHCKFEKKKICIRYCYFKNLNIMRGTAISFHKKSSHLIIPHACSEDVCTLHPGQTFT